MTRYNPFLLVLLALLGYLSFRIFVPFWTYTVLGILIAYLGRGPYRWMVRRVRGSRGIAAAIVLTLALLVVIAPLAYVSYALVIETTTVVQGLSSAQTRDFVNGVVSFSQENLDWPPPGENTTAFEDAVAEITPIVRARLTDWLPSAVTFLGVFIAGVSVALFIAYYGLKDGASLVRFLKDIIPLSKARMDLYTGEIDAIIDGVFLGQIVTAVVQGVLGFLAFWVLGIPNALFWSFIMAILSFLPVVGAFFVWMPVMVVLFAIGRVGAGVALALWGFLVISSVDNFIKPKLISGRSQLHPALALLGVLGGLAVFGFMGFIVGPLVIALFVATLRALREDQLTARAMQPPPDPHGGDPPGDEGT